MGSLRRWGVSATATALALAASPPAGAEERFGDLVHGGVVATGNTLGLSKANSSNAPGNLGSIGTFIGGTGTDGTYPSGTTSDWHANESTATLTLPAGASVAYAELVWGGSTNYPPEDVTASLDTAVHIGFGAASQNVSPAATTKTTISQSGPPQLEYYMRSADVTAFVAAHGSGSYRVGGVPGTQGDTSNALNGAGWSLAVVYERTTDPLRFAGIDVPSGMVADEFSPLDTTFDGFCTPASATAPGTLFASALEGDATLSGDGVSAGAGVAELDPVLGPNNPQANFFASQINGSDGLIDTRGSFGTANHDAAGGVNVAGGRQSWDVTTVPLAADELTGGDDHLLVRALTAADDAYMPTLIGLQADVGAPRFTAGSGSLSPATIDEGGTATLTIPLNNTAGNAAATGLTLKLPLPAGVGIDSFAINGVPGDVDGAPVTKAGLTAGADVGTVAAGSTKTVTIKLSGDAAGSFLLTPSWTFSFEQCAGIPGGSETVAGTGRTLTIEDTPPVDRTAPETMITRAPGSRVKKKRVTFGFSASEAGSSFECRLDRKPFAACGSPLKLKARKGRHTFEVRATDVAGNTDATPASKKFKVVKKKRPKR